jgi:hypothetical protein
MTTKDALIAVLGEENNISDDIIEKAFLDYGDEIAFDDDYDQEYKKDVDLIALSIIKYLLAKPDEVREGGYSVKYDKKYLMALQTSLSVANGLPDPNVTHYPKITSKSYLW